MKRLISTATILTLVLTILASCSEKPLSGSRYVVKEASGYNDSSVGNHKSEYEIAENKSEVEKSHENEQKTFEWLRNSYTAVYKETITKPSDKYREYTGDGFSFSIDTETGKLTEFSLSKIDNTGLTEKTDDERRAAAYDVVKSLVSDPESYSLIGSDCFYSAGTDSIWVYNYSRMISGMMSEDQISVYITYYGTYMSHSSTALEKYKNISLPTTYNKADADNALEIKLESIYSKAKANNNVAIPDEYGDGMLMKLTNGELGIMYRLSVTVNQQSEPVCLIVELGK